MFNTKIPLYGIMILLSLISNVIVIYIICQRGKKLSQKETIDLLIYELFGILLGAKLYSLLISFKKIDVLNFNYLGLSSCGAVIGALLFVYLFSLRYKKNFIDILGDCSISIPLMYSLGKIGCFFVGCCYGIKYNGIFAVTYHYSMIAPNGTPLFPVQIAESIVFFVVFIYALIMNITKRFTINKLGILSILCGLGKFLLDFLRESHSGIFLSINQIVCLMFIFLGGILYLLDKNNIKQKSIQ